MTTELIYTNTLIFVFVLPVAEKASIEEEEEDEATMKKTKREREDKKLHIESH